MPACPNPSMPQHPHHNKLYNLFPISPPHPIFVCLYLTCTPMYAPYAVPPDPHIPPLYYLCKSSNRLTSYVLPPHSSENLVKTEERRRKEDPTKKIK